MVTDADILRVIRERPVEVAAALLSIQDEIEGPTSDLDALIAVARSLQVDLDEFVLNGFLVPKGLRLTFVRALEARGIAFTEVEPGGALDFNGGADFLLRAKAFRCKIEAGEGPDSIGSGCLVSPHLVMTAAHVIKHRPSEGGAVIEPLRVVLSDGTMRNVIGPPVYVSECSDTDYDGPWPKDDVPFQGCNDIALLRLETAEGAKFGYPKLPATSSGALAVRNNIMLVHYPEGEDTNAVATGRATGFRGVTARVKHDAVAAPGSSGGPCFGLNCELIGLHQGRWEDRRRLVPVSRFSDPIKGIIEADIAPLSVWSLTDSVSGRVVFGRDDLFGAMAEAQRPASRARGLRMLRADPNAADGLSLNREIVQRLIQLRPERAIFVRLPASGFGVDMFGAIVAAARAAGLSVDPVAAEAGVAEGETTYEATVRDKAIRLMSTLNAAASGSQLWLYFEEDAGLVDQDQIGLEMLIEASFSQPAVRLILAGHEGISTPGEAFDTPGMAGEVGPPGLINVRVEPFSLIDVRLCLERAYLALGKACPAPNALDAIVQNAVLHGLKPFNGRYGLTDYGSVERRLKDLLWPDVEEAAA